MTIRKYINKDAKTIFELYNLYAPQSGYAKLSHDEFNKLVIKNKFFDSDYAFLLCAGETAVGFVLGAASSELPMGEQRGYFSCLALCDNASYDENAALLLSALEKAFVSAGKIFSDAMFFNPIRLPWVIPDTNNHLHNNVPGIWGETRLYKLMIKMGYIARANECAMYMNLKNYEIPKEILQKKDRAACEGYNVETYKPRLHTGLYEMLNTLGNPEWETEISRCAENDVPFLVAVHNELVVGFAGPIYPEKSGRGYFTGIGVVPAHEGHGLGTVLFYELCYQEKAAGAKYMSLFTGEENPAKIIYKRAGFIDVRTFALMRKTL